jgi:hypothetical protein
VLPAGAVEQHKGTPAQQQARADDLARYTNRVLSELARDRRPVSTIDPRVAEFLRTHAELNAGKPSAGTQSS